MPIEKSIRPSNAPKDKTKSKRKLFPTITQSFLYQVETHPNTKVYFTKKGSEWIGVTWSEYFEMVREISLGLTELGVTPGSRVGLISNTKIEWAATDMAILGAKAITVPVYASNLAEECAYILNHCEAEVVFLEDNKQLEKILSIKNELQFIKHIVVFDLKASPLTSTLKNVLSLQALRELGKRNPKQDLFVQNLKSITPNDVFTICYTSGTTGVPKGVVLTFDSLASFIEDVDLAFGKIANDSHTVLSFLPISHIFGKVESMATYHFGWKVYYSESVDKILINLAEVSPTILFAVPRIFEKAYTRIKAALDDTPMPKKKLIDWAFSVGRTYYEKIWDNKSPSLNEKMQYELALLMVFKSIQKRFGGHLKFCIAGGAPLSREIGEFMRIIGIPVFEGYGLTETCAPVTLNTIDAVKFGSVGKPLHEVAVKISEDGEILIKSRKVLKEYYKNPEATAEAIDSNGWFHTGDIGHIDQEGFVIITDRKKDLIITSGGKNVAPQKIENLAKTHKFISQFVVHGDKRNYLTALVVLDNEAIVKYAKDNNILFSEYAELVKNPKIIALVQEIVGHVNEKLASYESIKKFKILPHDFSIETGELTPSLKVKRKFCNQKYEKELAEMY